MEDTYSVQYLPKHFKCSNKTQVELKSTICRAGHVFTSTSLKPYKLCHNTKLKVLGAIAI